MLMRMRVLVSLGISFFQILSSLAIRDLFLGGVSRWVDWWDLRLGQG